MQPSFLGIDRSDAQVFLTPGVFSLAVSRHTCRGTCQIVRGPILVGYPLVGLSFPTRSEIQNFAADQADHVSIQESKISNCIKGGRTLKDFPVMVEILSTQQLFAMVGCK